MPIAQEIWRVVIEIDPKLLFMGLSAVISIASLIISISIKKDVKSSNRIELLHKKRIYVAEQLAEIGYIVKLGQNKKFHTQKLTDSYNRLLEHRNMLLDEFNKPSEMIVNPKHLNENVILNEISDLAAMSGFLKTDVKVLEKALT